MLIFDDESENDWNRREGAGAAVAGESADGRAAADGRGLQSGGPDLFLHAAQHESAVRRDGVEDRCEDWVIEKQFKSVPNVVDVSSFGGPTREYQVRVDPDKLIAYGLSIGQVEQQLTNNNVNAGGSFIEAGLQQINVRAVGLVKTGARYRRHGAQDPERDAAAREGYRDGGAGPKIRLGQIGQRDSPRGRQDRRQRRRGGRHRAAAQRRRIRMPRSRRFTPR